MLVNYEQTKLADQSKTDKKKSVHFKRKNNKEKNDVQEMDKEEEKQDRPPGISWNIHFDKNIEFNSDKAKIKLIGGSTAVQIKLPNALYEKPKVLLFVKEGDTYKMQ